MTAPENVPLLATLRIVKPAINILFVAAAAAVAVALVVTRRPGRPPAAAGSWQPIDRPAS